MNHNSQKYWVANIFDRRWCEVRTANWLVNFACQTIRTISRCLVWVSALTVLGKVIHMIPLISGLPENASYNCFKSIFLSTMFFRINRVRLKVFHRSVAFITAISVLLTKSAKLGDMTGFFLSVSILSLLILKTIIIESSNWSRFQLTKNFRFWIHFSVGSLRVGSHLG